VNGFDARDGVLLAVEEINEAGGLLNRPLKAYVRDDQCMPATFTRETEKLIQKENVAVMLGIACGPIEVAMTSLAKKHDKPCFAPSVLQITQHKFVKGEGAKQFFSPLPSTSNYALAGASFIVKDLGKKRIYLLGADFIYPQENLPVYEQVITNAPGAEVVGSDYFPPGTVDFSPILSKVRQANADLIGVVTFGQDTINLVNQAYEFGLLGDKTVAYLDWGTGYTLANAVTREALPYTYWGTPFYWEYELPSTKAFASRYVDKYGKVPSSWALAGYMEVKMWAQAVEKAGTLQGDSLYQALLATKGDFGNGEMRMKSFDHTPIGNLLITQGKKPQDIKNPNGWDLLKVVAKKSGEDYTLTREELASYPAKIKRVP
jgi:ABC-type branched-subunit amino acid transport system substrate-binding protein